MEALKLNSETAVASFAPPQMKKCKCCGELKPISEFYSNSAFKDGRDSTCGACRRAQAKEKTLARQRQKQNIKTKVVKRETKKADGSLRLKDFTLDELTMELRNRGYAGELRRTITVTI